MKPTPPVGGSEIKPSEQYTIPAPQYSAPVPAAPVAPAPAPQRVEPSYNYSPPAYAAPKYNDQAETYPREAPKTAPVRPRETLPQDNVEERYDRNRIGRSQPKSPHSDDYAEDHHERGRTVKPPQYEAPRLHEEAGEDHGGQPWNRPVAEGVPPCPLPSRGSVCAHTVSAGETLSSIAQERYGYNGPRTIAKIVSVNPGLDPDRIYIGQVLYLPCACGAAPVPEPEAASRYSQQNYILAGSVENIPVSAY